MKTKLDEFIENKLNEPFKYGVNDCITFSAQAIELVTGIDHIKIVGKWSSEEEASKLLKKMGFNSLSGVIGSRFRKHSHQFKLKDGDVVVSDQTLDRKFKEQTCIYYKGKLVGPAKDGLQFMNVDQGKYFFDIKRVRIG
tara:strand:- start:12142 stop:12558 length:417 start_codon:yes stop_codon:yes gene_type:complete